MHTHKNELAVRPLLQQGIDFVIIRDFDFVFLVLKEWN